VKSHGKFSINRM